MQVVILAGGLGTRLAEETDFIPKPMVRIGNLPILHHIMNFYADYGHSEFLIALGYRSESVHEYFRDIQIPRWSVNLVETGLETSTGGRIKLLESYLRDEFMLTYGDGLSNVNLNELVNHHKRFDKIATVTAVRPPARFGTIEFSNGMVTKFAEKDPQDAGWINGGFFYFKKKICEFINDLTAPLEGKPLQALTELKELTAFEHHGWWQPMDTLRDKRTLEAVWETGAAPWLIKQ